MELRLQSARDENAQIASELFRVIGIPFEETSELQRQILAAFAFGMTFAASKMKQLPPPDVQALVICCLVDVFKYSDEQAAAFSARLISAASSKDPNDTMKAIIHRGIDGHNQVATATERSTEGKYRRNFQSSKCLRRMQLSTAAKEW